MQDFLKQYRQDKVHMLTAMLYASLSKAERKKVGACLVTASGVVVPGYNGTVSGSDNTCESLQSLQPVRNASYDYVMRLTTNPGVLHAELNCLMKCSKEGISSVGSTLYVTLSPCQQCAAMIAQAGIERVVYLEKYRNDSGIADLLRYNIRVDDFKNLECCFNQMGG